MSDVLPNDSRRRFPRIRSRNAILVSRMEAAPLEDLGSTNSIGAGGCGFISHEAFGVGTRVKLLISIEHSVVQALGRVVYEEALGGGQTEIGVEFEDLPPGDLDRIEALVEDPPSE